MPQLHMPVQSGSDAILKAMRRLPQRGSSASSTGSARQIPHAAITTDIIVGFPGETEADFDETLRVVEASRFASAFTFQYSIRPGTPAATMPDQVPKAVVQDRFDRLIALQEEISWAENRAQEGREVEVLVAPGEGRKDTATAACPGAPATTVSSTSPCPRGPSARDPGTSVTVGVTYGAPHHLIADSGLRGGPYAVRRTPRRRRLGRLADGAAPGSRCQARGLIRYAVARGSRHRWRRRPGPGLRLTPTSPSPD
jgi:tRNA-2-methylthio-N6-dimethylallyladenosine synthase